jgi:hypothetical protein
MGKGDTMGKLLLVIIGLMLVAAAISALVKGIVVLAAIAIGLMLLAGLYQVRPKAFYAVCIAATIALLPTVIWPWVGIAVILWLFMEVAAGICARTRRQRALRVPSA